MRRILLAGAVALLCLAGSADARSTADQALAVSVDGGGTIAATGIDCRDESGDCVELYADGTTVTLTATPDTGATFAGWGGDCAAATGTSCTLTMSSAKAVTATFTAEGGAAPPPGTSPPGTPPVPAGAAPTPTLTVTVTGSGRIVGPGIDCGGGSNDCSESYPAGRNVFVTALPAADATFAGWSGSCSGQVATCSLVMSAAKEVAASFGQGGTRTGTTFSAGARSGPATTGAPARPTTATFAARSLGRPLVSRTSRGWRLTLRFFTSHVASGLVQLSLNGRPTGAYTFPPRRGNVLVGPFDVSRRGAYRFQLTLSAGGGAVARLAWTARV